MKFKFSYGDFIMLVIGALLLFTGSMELKLLMRSSALPTNYSVADLQNGASVENLNGQLDTHYAIYDSAIYKARIPRGKDKPKNDAIVEDLWYPILAELPDSDTDASNFRVIVKVTHGYKVNNLPSGVQKIDSSKGMFLDGFHSLQKKEKAFIKQEFPNIDFENVLLFQLDRERSSTTKVALFLLGGLALILIPIFGKDKRKQ